MDENENDLQTLYDAFLFGLNGIMENTKRLPNDVRQWRDWDVTNMAIECRALANLSKAIVKQKIHEQRINESEN